MRIMGICIFNLQGLESFRKVLSIMGSPCRLTGGSVMRLFSSAKEQGSSEWNQSGMGLSMCVSIHVLLRDVGTLFCFS